MIFQFFVRYNRIIRDIKFNFFYLLLKSWIEQRNILEENDRDTDTVINQRDLATEKDLIQALKHLKNRESRASWKERKLVDNNLENLELHFLTLMILTGRRAADIFRMRWNSVKVKQDSIMVVLPKDKQNRTSLVSFTFEFGDWDVDFSLKDFEDWFVRGITKKEGLIFEKNKISKQIISRACKFRLHATRNRKTISLIIKKVPEQEIMEKVGWNCLQSVLHYAKVSPDFLKKFDSYEEAVNFILKF